MRTHIKTPPKRVVVLGSSGGSGRVVAVARGDVAVSLLRGDAAQPLVLHLPTEARS